MGEVVSPFGPLISAEAPDQTVVDFLERLLEEARRGEINTIAVAYVRPSREKNWEWKGSGYVDSLLASVQGLSYSLTRSWVDSD